MKLSLIPSVEYINEEQLKGKTIVIIDVLRATTVITTALENGAAAVITTLEIDEALALRREGYLLGGERKALKIAGFDLSNSPLAYTRDAVAGKTIVLTTTNGTRAIHKSRLGEKIFIGCMRNGSAVAEKFLAEGRDVVVVCAGTQGRFSLDDFICAGKIIHAACSNMNILFDDFAAAAYMAYQDHKHDTLAYVKWASHYQYLLSIGLEQDIAYCFTDDVSQVVPHYANGKIIL